MEHAPLVHMFHFSRLLANIKPPDLPGTPAKEGATCILTVHGHEGEILSGEAVPLSGDWRPLPSDSVGKSKKCLPRQLFPEVFFTMKRNIR